MAASQAGCGSPIAKIQDVTPMHPPSTAAEYTPLRHLAGRSTLAPVQWARLIAGPCDIRQLTGQTCKNNDVDFYMLYRSSETGPITDFS